MKLYYEFFCFRQIRPSVLKANIAGYASGSRPKHRLGSIVGHFTGTLAPGGKIVLLHILIPMSIVASTENKKEENEINKLHHYQQIGVINK